MKTNPGAKVPLPQPRGRGQGWGKGAARHRVRWRTMIRLFGDENFKDKSHIVNVDYPILSCLRRSPGGGMNE